MSSASFPPSPHNIIPILQLPSRTSRVSLYNQLHSSYLTRLSCLLVSSQFILTIHLVAKLPQIVIMPHFSFHNPHLNVRKPEPGITICETCDNRQLKTKDWPAHKASKKHRANEDAIRNKENEPVSGSTTASDSWGGGETTTNFGGDGAWNDAPSAGFSNDPTPSTRGVGGGFRGACYGCGLEGHSKRDCPTSAGGGGRGNCYNCGQPG